MKLANSVTELIGNTPLVRINRINESAGATIAANSNSLTRRTASRTASVKR